MEQLVESRLLHPSGFLLTFEQLGNLLPATLVIAATPPFIYHALWNRRCIQASPILWIKLAIATALSAVQIHVVFRWWETSPQEPMLARWAANASYMSMPSLALIVSSGHLFSLESAPFLSVFLAVTLMIDIVAFPTYFYPSSLGQPGDPRTAILVLKTMLLLLEQVPKHKHAIPEVLSTESEIEDAGFAFSRMPLSRWIQSVLLLGFRIQIEREHLPELDEDLEAKTLYDAFKPHWQNVQKSSYPLVRAIIYTVPDLVFSTVPPLLLKSVFRLSQPFLLRDVLVALSGPSVPATVAAKLLTTTAMVYLGISASSTWATYSIARLHAAARAISQAAIYNKCLTLNASKLEIASVSLMMSSDLDNISWFITTHYNNWNTVLEIAFNVAVLASLYGPSALLLVVPALLAGANAIRIGRHESTDRSEWRRRTEDHIALTSNILAQIKDIKMLGLGSYLGKLIQSYQKEEIRASLPVRDAESIGFMQGAFTESGTPMVSIAIAVFPLLSSKAVSTPDFCAAMAMGLVSMQPLAYAVRSMSDRLRGLNAVRRIQDFLLQKDNHDCRVCAPERLYAVLHDTATNQNVVTRFAIQFIDASISLGADKPILQGISLCIPKGKVTMIYGRTGSGKSVFSDMIVGQAPLSTGTLLVATNSIAYCTKKPWIRNVSIRDNIVGESPFDPAWFNLVIYVCALNIDLSRLAYGILTLAGTGGSNLSAGQRQRISFARSLYAKKEIIVVDDILTSLDKRTASDIRVRLFGETEILQENNITLIMTTTMREHLVDADFALEITDDGFISEAAPSSDGEGPRTLPNGVANGVVHGVAGGESETPAVNAPPLVGSRANDTPDRVYGDWSLYVYFLKPAGLFLVLLWIYTLVAAAVVENLPVAFVSFWMEHAPQDAYFLIFATFSLANPIFNHFTTTATFDYLSSTDTSFLLNKFCQDVTSTTETLPLLIMPMAWNFVLLITNMIAFGLATSGITLPVVLLVCLFGVQFFYNRSSRHLRIMNVNAGADLSKQLSDTCTGAAHIYSFGWQSAFLSRFYSLLSDAQRAAFYRSCLGQWLKLVLTFLTAVAATSIVSHSLNSGNEFSPGIFAFSMFSVIVFENNMRMLIHPWVASDAMLGALHRVRTFVSSTPVEMDPGDVAPISPQWARRGKIELSCVTAQYRPIGGARHTALNHVSFTIQPGQIVGIAGRTGSGKTSLFLAMLNLLHFEGAILIDDREIRTIPHELLRSRITVMTQTLLELKGTVRFNVNPFDPQLRPKPFILNDDMLVGIFRRVGLWDHIADRGGLDVQIGLMKFSHGQKQLFQLARAMLHKQMMRTKIIFIDEGAPNAEIEDHMRQVMREVFAGCTILMVSHRPSLFREADRILTIDAGKACLYEHDRERGTWSANRWNYS